jgi:hypothetical protein
MSIATASGSMSNSMSSNATYGSGPVAAVVGSALVDAVRSATLVIPGPATVKTKFPGSPSLAVQAPPESWRFAGLRPPPRGLEVEHVRGDDGVGGVVRRDDDPVLRRERRVEVAVVDHADREPAHRARRR